MRSIVIGAVLLLVACADKQHSEPPPDEPQPSTAASAQAASASASPNSSSNAAERTSSAPAADVRPALNGRKGEIVNPDNSAIVFLYYDLAGLAPPLARWVEEDGRVKFAAPIDKAGLRSSIRAELESAMTAVHDIGFIRLTMQANLSEYDPAYGEFAVRALAPSSIVSFDAFGEKVSLKFGNGRTAQIWRVPPAQAQAIRDKIGYFHNVSLDALLRITAVQPGPAGGTITTDVVEYEMREAQRGLTIGRVQVE